MNTSNFTFLNLVVEVKIRYFISNVIVLKFWYISESVFF